MRVNNSTFVPRSHRLTALETKLLEAIQCMYADREAYEIANENKLQKWLFNRRKRRADRIPQEKENDDRARHGQMVQ